MERLLRRMGIFFPIAALVIGIIFLLSGVENLLSASTNSFDVLFRIGFGAVVMATTIPYLVGKFEDWRDTRRVLLRAEHLHHIE